VGEKLRPAHQEEQEPIGKTVRQVDARQSRACFGLGDMRDNRDVGPVCFQRRVFGQRLQPMTVPSISDGRPRG